MNSISPTVEKYGRDLCGATDVLSALSINTDKGDFNDQVYT